MTPNIQPDFLHFGDKVSIVSTARKVSKKELQPAIDVLNSWGLEVVLGQHLFEDDNQFAGSDTQRLSDLQNAFNDTRIKAIFCARGGYGTPRIVDWINWETFVKHPKWVIGFSDVTILLNEIQNHGIDSLHAPMPMYFAQPTYQNSINALKELLFGKEVDVIAPPHFFNRLGNAQGILVGGNLSLIVNSIGTQTAFDPNGKILFLEDIDEYLYHIDRMILHLKRASVFDKLSGLVIGHFTDMKDNTIPFGETAFEIIVRNIAEYDFPVAFGFPIGHEPQNMPIIVGANYNLEVNESGATLEFL